MPVPSNSGLSPKTAKEVQMERERPWRDVEQIGIKLLEQSRKCTWHLVNMNVCVLWYTQLPRRSKVVPDR